MEPPDNGRIGEQHTAYRRGLVLGLTMAEVGILIIFVLLLLIALGLRRQHDMELQTADTVQISGARAGELNHAESSLAAISKAVGLRPNASPQDIERLVRIAQEAAASAEGTSALAKARGALADLEAAHDAIQRLARAASTDGGKSLADKMVAQESDLAIKEGQLKYYADRLAQFGQGKGERPCWVERDGTIVYLYDVILTSQGIKMRERLSPTFAAERTRLPLPKVDLKEVLDEQTFLKRTRDVYEYGQRDEKRCRFYVFVWDGTKVEEKPLYKHLLDTVEGHFYKQYKVKDGIPF